MIGYCILDTSNNKVYAYKHGVFTNGIGRIYSARRHAEARKVILEGDARRFDHYPPGPFKVIECAVIRYDEEQI